MNNIESEELHRKFVKLHELLINQVIAFCKDNHLEIDECNLYADGLCNSIKFGKWHPSTDSSLNFIINKDSKKEVFLYSM